MLKTLLTHEILNLLKSRRVYWTVIMFLLLFMSVFVVRVIDYQKQVNQYIADVKVADESLQNAENYSFINPFAIQQPIVFSIYNQGFKIPRVISIQYYEPIIGSTHVNEEKNILHIDDTSLDITFLVTFFLSLFILLIAYDSVNGEKQVGTLRILMTYPLKRQSVILKKVLGVFIFVAFTFTLPYLSSLIILTTIYANLLSINFFLSAFFYWFLVLLFIFFFSLLGVFISVCTTNPNRSLVYSLLVWILFSIVLPISWEYIAYPRLYNDKLVVLTQNYQDKVAQANRIFNLQEVDETKYDIDQLSMYNVGYIQWQGHFYTTLIWSFESTHQQWYRFMQYVIDEYYPASQAAERAVDELYLKRIDIENTKSMIFFFNPIMLFESLSMEITGNSRKDQLQFIHHAREIRSELVSLGVTEGWLKDYRFFAVFKEEYTPEAAWEDGMDWNTFWPVLQQYMETAEQYEMTLPTFRTYQQPIFTFGEIFARILRYVVLFVASIVALWLMTWWKFMKYDVR